MKKQSSKQPLRESLIKIGGKHLLNEGKDEIFKYKDELEIYIQGLRPNIRGWKFGVDHMSGAWEWQSTRVKDVSIFATWGWEGREEIPLETSDGDSLPAVKLKLNPKTVKKDDYDTMDPSDEKQLKKDSKKYLDKMKKEFPKIEKKLLEY